MFLPPFFPNFTLHSTFFTTPPAVSFTSSLHALEKDQLLDGQIMRSDVNLSKILNSTVFRSSTHETTHVQHVQNMFNMFSLNFFITHFDILKNF